MWLTMQPCPYLNANVYTCRVMRLKGFVGHHKFTYLILRRNITQCLPVTRRERLLLPTNPILRPRIQLVLCFGLVLLAQSLPTGSLSGRAIVRLVPSRPIERSFPDGNVPHSCRIGFVLAVWLPSWILINNFQIRTRAHPVEWGYKAANHCIVSSISFLT